MVCTLYAVNRTMDGSVDRANAQLIAAAPDLFESLKDAYRYIFTDDGPDEIDRGELATQIEAVLLKAVASEPVCTSKP